MPEPEQKMPDPGPIAPVIVRIDPDASIARGKWERAQKDLAREKRSRQAESTQRAAQIEHLHAQLRNTTAALEEARTPRKRGGKLALIVTGCVAASVAVGVLAYTVLTRGVSTPARVPSLPHWIRVPCPQPGYRASRPSR